MSLGVDPIPFKTCNWNCVYCQLGRSAPLVVERGEYLPTREIVAQIRAALAAAGSVDWITFVGSGEPTLHSGLGRMIRAVREFSELPRAVITNGSLLHLAEVREELSVAEAVLPTLDAGSDRVYRLIDRASPQLPFEQFIQGLVDFGAGYAGRLQVEVMLVKGINDDEQSLRELADILTRVRHDEVQINVPSRPGADSRALTPDPQTIARAEEMLGAGRCAEQPGKLALELGEVGSGSHLADLLVGVVTRHPMDVDRLLLDLNSAGVEQPEVVLDDLLRSGRVQQVSRQGRRFLCAGAGRFGA